MQAANVISVDAMGGDQGPAAVVAGLDSLAAGEWPEVKAQLLWQLARPR